MNRYLKKIEHLADALIPPALLGVTIILGLELGFPEVAHNYHSWINYVDYAIIGIFSVDLSFKAHRASRWDVFLKEHWLEIVAIMPFFLMFRVFEFLRLIAGIETGQEAAHLASGARSSRFTRIIRPLSRSPRLARAAEFFDHPEKR